MISGILKGSGRQYIGAIVNFFAYYVIGIPLAVVIGIKTNLGIIGIWIGMAIGNFAQVSKVLERILNEDQLLIDGLTSHLASDIFNSTFLSKL